MAEFLHSTFQDDKAQLWRIEIHDTDFSGSSTQFHVTSEGFQLKYQGDTEKPLQPIVGSTLSFVMQIEDGAQGLDNSTTLDGFLSTLLTADEDRFTVVVREGALSSDDVYWVGIIQPEQMIILDESYPRSVEIIAADDLANLKGVEYTDDGTPYTGQASILVHLIRCLNKTRTTQHWGGTDVFLETQEYFKLTSAGSSDTYLSCGFMNEDLYQTTSGVVEYMPTYDVLEQICETFGASLYQARGRWFFIPRLYGTHSVTYNVNQYADTGQLLDSDVAHNYGKLINQSVNRVYRLTGGEFTHLNAYKEVRRSYNYNGNVPLLQPSFDATDLGSTTYTNDAFIVPSGGNLRAILTLNLSLNADGTRIGDERAIRLLIQITLKCGDNYYKYHVVVSNFGTDFYLADNDTINVFNYFAPALSNVDWNTTNTNRLEFFTNAMDWEFGDELQQNFNVATVELPSDGSGVEIELDFVAYDAAGNTSQTLTNDVLDDLTVDGRFFLFATDGASSAGDSIIYSAESNNNAREIYELNDSIFGDQISTVNTRGALRRSDTNYTDDEWYTLNEATENFILETLVQEHLAFRNTPRQVIRATLFDDRLYFDNLFRYSGDYYAAMSWTFSANAAQYEVELFELDRDGTGITVAQSDRIPTRIPEFEIFDTTSDEDVKRSVGETNDNVAAIKTRLTYVIREDYKTVPEVRVGSLDTGSGEVSARGVLLQAPDDMSADQTFVLPSADGTTGQFLRTDGSGNLTFDDAGGGGGSPFVAQLTFECNASTGNYYFGNFRYGWNYIVWNQNDSDFLNVFHEFYNCGICVVGDYTTAKLKGVANNDSYSGAVIEFQLWKQARPNGSGSSFSPTSLGSVSVTMTVQSRQYNVDLTATGVTISDGDLIFLTVRRTTGAGTTYIRPSLTIELS